MMAASAYADVWKEIQPDISPLRRETPEEPYLLFSMRHFKNGDATRDDQEGTRRKVLLEAKFELRHSDASFSIRIDETDNLSGHITLLVDQLYAMQRPDAREQMDAA
jgi:hypothetical protein